MKVYSRWNHSFCIDKDGRVYLFGCNEWGQIGNGSVYFVYDPHLFQSMEGYENVIIINGSCGRNHTVLLDEDRKRIYTFGWNKYNVCTGDDMDDKLKKAKKKNNKKSKKRLIPCMVTMDMIDKAKNGQIIERVIAGDNATLIVCY